MKKREFIKTTALAGLSLPFSAVTRGESNPSDFLNTSEKLNEEDFLKNIRSQYELPKDWVYLENGYYNLLPKYILDKHFAEIQRMNLWGSIYMRTQLSEDRAKNRGILSEFLGVRSDEIIITRNTTESIDTIISGFPWKEGDSAVMAEQDYGSMLDMFSQISERHAVKCKKIILPLHPKNDAEIVKLYEDAIDQNTRLLLVSHMINITGQILPIRKIVEMAHKKGVRVIVDGAHAIGQFDFKISELGCDFYACSLHKWMSVPLGAGLLYANKKSISDVWPLFAESGRDSDDLLKLNHTGTAPAHIENTIPHAIAFMNKIGGVKAKEKHLRKLKQYLHSSLSKIPGVYINTPESEERSCGILNFGLSGYTPAMLCEKLKSEFRIFTVAINVSNVQGIRVTPGLFTEISDLDQLIKATAQLAADQNRPKK